MRLFGPVEEMWAKAQAQTHRRFFKSHLPFDALPVRQGVKFIHVARDGRDAALSLHNHLSSFLPETLEALDAISLEDPRFGDPYPRPPDDPAAFFHDWVSDDMHNGQGDPAASFFHVENSYWPARDEPNMLLVHYADLKKDRGGEMRRVADFLEIDLAESSWPSLIEAASFDSMKRDGNELVPELRMFWGDDGTNRFFNRGTNRRWHNVVDDSDLRLYQTRTSEEFAPDLADWLENGRLAAS
jgi:aryl sulfotransferase